MITGWHKKWFYLLKTRSTFFFQIYVEALTAEDYQVILGHFLPIVRTEEEMWKKDLTTRMTEFSERLNELIVKGKLGVLGGPWELNLRDLIRWCAAIADEEDPSKLLDSYFL